jgi:hypothetical protein
MRNRIAIVSAPATDLVTRFDLCDDQVSSWHLPCLSAKKMQYPNCDDPSALLPKDAFAYTRKRRESRSSLGYFRGRCGTRAKCERILLSATICSRLFIINASSVICADLATAQAMSGLV